MRLLEHIIKIEQIIIRIDNKFVTKKKDILIKNSKKSNTDNSS